MPSQLWARIGFFMNATESVAQAEPGLAEETQSPPDSNLTSDRGSTGEGCETNAHETAKATEKFVQLLRGLFGPDDRVLEITTENPSFPKELRRDSGVQSEFKPEWPPGSRYLGVQCGDPGSGQELVAVIIFTASALKNLFSMNPGLRGGLVTKWGPGLIVWLRATGHPKSNVHVGPLTWFCRGVVPVAALEAAFDSFVVQKRPIPVCRFQELEWEELVLGTFEIANVEAEMGPPIKKTSSGKFRLNDMFWCELIVRRLGLIYDVYRQTFVRKDGDGRHVPDGEVIQLVTRVLQSGAASLGEQFPQSEISLRRVQQLVRMMQGRAAMTSVDDQTLINQFVDGNVERHAGSTLESDELLERFRTECNRRNIPAPSEALFYRTVAKTLGSTSHCFGPDGNKRGRYGWRLKPQNGKK